MGSEAPDRSDKDARFRTEHLEKDLKQRSIKGGIVTLLGQAAKFALTFGKTMILARLLTPADFGMVSMVTAITGFIAIFKDLGLSQATVQKKEVTHDDVSAMFWVNVAAASLLTILTAAGAPLVAWFYGEPKLVPLTMAFAMVFLVGGFGVQHTAILRREMRFGAIAASEVAGMVVGTVVGVGAAAFGAGFWALFYGQVAITLTSTTWVWAASRWVPSRPRRSAGARDMLRFGGNLTLANTLSYVSRNLDNVLIGRVWGPTELGLYSRAYSFLLMPIQQINAPVHGVVVPVLSRLQNDPARYRLYYNRALELLILIGAPLVGATTVAADELVTVFLGEQWLGAAKIYVALFPVAFLGTTNLATGWVYLSLGRTDRQLRAELVSSGLNVLAFLIGLRWGGIGVAIALSISSTVKRIPAVWYSYQGSPLTLADFFGVLWRPTVATLSAGGLVYALRFPLDVNPTPAVLGLVVHAGAFTLAYAIALVLLPGGFAHLRQALELFAELRKKRR